MSRDHKAFLFDYERFERELRPMILRAMERGDEQELAAFVERHRTELMHPYKETELGAGWRSEIGDVSVQDLAEIALTKFYDPLDDIGLSHSWEPVQERIDALGPAEYSPIMGTPLEAGGERFDPGLMGTYFQSPEMVRKGVEILTELSRLQPDTPELREALEMLEQARRRGLGLYVWF